MTEPTGKALQLEPTLFGRYTLLERLAVGGMSEVYRAEERRSGHPAQSVVIKKMLSSLATEAGARTMFEAEARLGALIEDENVVDVLGHGEEDGHPYLVLEYVQGVDLWKLARHLTRTGRKLSVSLAAHIMQGVLRGLHAVHETRSERGMQLGIVHRDVSPTNVLLSTIGDVKLADLGIAHAKLREVLPAAPTLASVKGKLGYLAPEQVQGEACDRRCDLFAAGVVLAELLLGRALFTGPSELAILLSIRDARIDSFLAIADTLPPELVALVKKALARKPADRMETALEFAEALTPFLLGSDADRRSELSLLVQDAMARRDSGQMPVINLPLPALEGTEALLNTSSAPPGYVSGTPSTRPNTAEVPRITYDIRTEGGAQLGPWPFARVVEAVSTGELGPTDAVRIGSAEYKKIDEITELARHMPVSSRTPITRENATPSASEKLGLVDGGVIRAFGYAMLRQDTGLWLFEHGGARKEVYIRNGVPEYVTSNLAGELFGEFLVKSNIIARGELEMALAVMPRYEGKLGETLTALGLIEPLSLFQHLSNQVREKLLDLFLWTSGDAIFYPGLPAPESGFPLGIDTWQVLNEGIKRRINKGLEDARIKGRMRDTLCAATPVPTALRDAPLPTELRMLLNALASPRSLFELTQMLADPRGQDQQRGLRAVLILLHLEAIRWV